MQLASSNRIRIHPRLRNAHPLLPASCVRRLSEVGDSRYGRGRILLAQPGHLIHRGWAGASRDTVRLAAAWVCRPPSTA
jgi:hypothetical protein